MGRRPPQPAAASARSTATSDADRPFLEPATPTRGRRRELTSSNVLAEAITDKPAAVR
jgi:hypothetical protein